MSSTLETLQEPIRERARLDVYYLTLADNGTWDLLDPYGQRPQQSGLSTEALAAILYVGAPDFDWALVRRVRITHAVPHQHRDVAERVTYAQIERAVVDVLADSSSTGLTLTEILDLVAARLADHTEGER